MNFETWTQMQDDAMEVIDRFAAAGIHVPPARNGEEALNTLERVAVLKNRAMDARRLDEGERAVMSQRQENEEDEARDEEENYNNYSDEELMDALREIRRMLRRRDRVRADDARLETDLEYYSRCAAASMGLA